MQPHLSLIQVFDARTLVVADYGWNQRNLWVEHPSSKQCSCCLGGAPLGHSYLCVQKQWHHAILADPVKQRHVERKVKGLWADNGGRKLLGVAGHHDALRTARERHEHGGLRSLRRLVDDDDAEDAFREHRVAGPGARGTNNLRGKELAIRAATALVGGCTMRAPVRPGRPHHRIFRRMCPPPLTWA